MKSNFAGIGLAVLLFAACASAPGSAVELGGTRWHLVTADKGALAKYAPKSGVTLEFSADRVSGYGGCNTYSSSYGFSAGRLTVSRVSATKRSCMDAANEIERAWFAALASPLSVTKVGGQLQLRAADGTTMRFATGSTPAKR